MEYSGDPLRQNREKEFSPEMEIPKENRFLIGLKNLLVFILLLLIVLASFWVSFQLGKRILMPVKKSEPFAVSAPGPSMEALEQKIQKMLKTETAKKAPSQPCKRVRKYTRVRMVTTGHFYKVQAGLYNNKTDAEALADKIDASSSEVYVKKVNGSWRVQVGAFLSKAKAEAQQAKLKTKGFDSEVIYE